jgi:hypothetical protein
MITSIITLVLTLFFFITFIREVMIWKII